jgi:sialate O-acetylesterase
MVFAINHWVAGGGADLGIGNSQGETRDWTFKNNAGNYTVKKLRVFVRLKQ